MPGMATLADDSLHRGLSLSHPADTSFDCYLENLEASGSLLCSSRRFCWSWQASAGVVGLPKLTVHG